MKSAEGSKNPQSVIGNRQLRGWHLWLLGILVAIPLLVFGIAGALWLYDQGWLGWVGLGFLSAGVSPA